MFNFTGTVSDIKKKLFQLDFNKKYDVEIKQHREKRSLNANSYAWHLISEIANVLNSDKDSIYLIMLKRYGVSDIIPVSNEVPINLYFKYFDIEAKNNKYTWYKVYRGSSQYNTKEMSIFINGIISECREMDIPTKEEKEIEALVRDWENYESKN